MTMEPSHKPHTSTGGKVKQLPSPGSEGSSNEEETQPSESEEFSKGGKTKKGKHKEEGRNHRKRETEEGVKVWDLTEVKRYYLHSAFFRGLSWSDLIVYG